jgi:hypothetical protein
MYGQTLPASHTRRRRRTAVLNVGAKTAAHSLARKRASSRSNSALAIMVSRWPKPLDGVRDKSIDLVCSADIDHLDVETVAQRLSGLVNAVAIDISGDDDCPISGEASSRRSPDYRFPLRSRLQRSRLPPLGPPVGSKGLTIRRSACDT